MQRNRPRDGNCRWTPGNRLVSDTGAQRVPTSSALKTFIIHTLTLKRYTYLSFELSGCTSSHIIGTTSVTRAVVQILILIWVRELVHYQPRTFHQRTKSIPSSGHSICTDFISRMRRAILRLGTLPRLSCPSYFNESTAYIGSSGEREVISHPQFQLALSLTYGDVFFLPIRLPRRGDLKTPFLIVTCIVHQKRKQRRDIIWPCQCA